jgi:hypothetical protein
LISKSDSLHLQQLNQLSQPPVHICHQHWNPQHETFEKRKENCGLPSGGRALQQAELQTPNFAERALQESLQLFGMRAAQLAA